MGRAVITGATGAIGRALVSEALKYHEEVLVIVRQEFAKGGGVKADEKMQSAGGGSLRVPTYTGAYGNAGIRRLRL